VTRIIGGSAGGRRLRTLPGDLTRPTADRVREALFSSLESALGSLAGSRFLDLYAGSGAVGLEATSRGAATVTLVEQSRRAARVIEDNARSLTLDVEVVCAPVARHLAGSPASPYDVVFVDPPYGLTPDEVVADLHALASGGWLVSGALVVVERSSRSTPVTWPDGYRPGRVRRYGETSLSTGTWVGLWYGREDAGTERDDQPVGAEAPPEAGPEEP
jgi:16S rRNA (guanine966-N2)-methyltransferase